MPDLRLVIFDVDGTLVDSQGEIIGAMTAAFDQVGVAMPTRPQILGIVGLSLERAFEVLCPDADRATQADLAGAYRHAFASLRDAGHDKAVLYPGARDVIETFAAQDHTLLAIATGKSRRGLDKVLERHHLTGMFHSEQVADHHPSKPDPSMILTAMMETGVNPQRTVMIGDTTFDMDMARAAGVKKIGVSWGYHPAQSLQPDALLDTFAPLPQVVDTLIGA